ncbi:hypothetical protein A9264_02235 [Vibrio sp. UCD-FRSSP16_10]|uniref:Card1-like endonuclease domain-containing protein n=1 Tax=unclassified Vibrio TaxID=2614977 RepID=UPI0007FD942C|nr:MULTISPECIES: DUF1887 family CARF protein [unclassified Vibrio]OBT13979.1 hypothetical protein A9260_03685 [Vibrio sp. UCD-FRSSP16_30]OBT22860.1 hypothetical protein A9264_02235 [Vibrio sp. UCD-FRSSP16_10]
MPIQLGIIDKDPIRLVTPLLDDRALSRHAIFIGDSTQKPMFDKLSIVLNMRGIKSEFFEISNVSDTAIIKQEITQLAERLRLSGDDIKLNASCGLRHRLLSVYEVVRSYKWPIFVVEPNSDRLSWLYPNSFKDVQVQDRITIADYLTIFGAQAQFPDPNEAIQIDSALLKICEKWASHALELGPGLATLNFLATTCRKEQKLDVELSEKQQGYRELNILLQDLVDAELATYHAGTLVFRSEQARRFSNGEWLESYVHTQIKSVEKELSTIQDCSLNVQVTRKIGDKEVRNELDVATVVNNKLHIIECKTKGMRDDGDDTLYKLESLRDLLGGLQARAMLVSFRPLRYNDITRAMDLGLGLIGPEELKDLKLHLKEWLVKAGGIDVI